MRRAFGIAIVLLGAFLTEVSLVAGLIIAIVGALVLLSAPYGGVGAGGG